MIREVGSAQRYWADGGVARVPYAHYTSAEGHARELDRIFYNGHWCYVGLEAELPEPRSFRTTWIGERAVIVTRDRDGQIHVLENRCAHRGVQFCQSRGGTSNSLQCPYHQWNYALDGRLIGLPFRGGVKGQGGMPADFRLENHGLTALKVATRGGAIFASFDRDVEPFEAYLGAAILPWFDRMFSGRPLTLLGRSRQRVPGNWKLMMENIKDPYHPGLLHSWFVTFGLWRADSESRMVMDAHGRHAAMISSRRQAPAGSDVTQGVASFRAGMTLGDPRLLDVVAEPWWGGPTVVMQTIFPSVILQQQVNSLSTRQIVPRGPHAFDFVWTHFGHADDGEEMTTRRLRQANLFGPAGFVSADDGEVIELAQAGMRANPDAASVNELDGLDVYDTDHMVTETLIRGMWRYWRTVMDA